MIFAITIFLTFIITGLLLYLAGSFYYWLTKRESPYYDGTPFYCHNLAQFWGVMVVIISFVGLVWTFVFQLLTYLLL